MKNVIKREAQNFLQEKGWTSLCFENTSSYQGSFICGKFVVKQVSFIFDLLFFAFSFQHYPQRKPGEERAGGKLGSEAFRCLGAG
ncbi:hypothetical protein [Blautia hominis]|uniref:hypothetical protein n=1 Tax=Blautia hominis TaxID=2025493 RepID=UPI0036F3872C